MSEQVVDGARQFTHMTNDNVGLQLRDGRFRVSECHPDDRNSGPPRNADIGSGIADHDRFGDVAASPRDGLAQDCRVGFGNAERVGPADRLKSLRHVQLFEQQP